MVQIRIAHGRVLTHDVHAAHLVRIVLTHQHLAHDFDHRVAVLLIQRTAPEALKPVVCRLVGDALVIGEHHRNQARVAGALHIVLSAQRVQSGAGLADLPSHHAQGNQCAHIVGAVYVLADPHAPENHGAPGLGVGACHFPNRLRLNAAHRRHRFRAETLHAGAHRLEIADA